MISQNQFDFLIKLEKKFTTSENISLGPPPLRWTREIESIDSREFFLLDFYRGNIELSRFTYNKRYRQTIVLLRYDSGGRHTNPDGVTFDGPHVHIFKEGYDDKFAYPVSAIGAIETNSMEETLKTVLGFCNVSTIPLIEVPMF